MASFFAFAPSFFYYFFFFGLNFIRWLCSALYDCTLSSTKKKNFSLAFCCPEVIFTLLRLFAVFARYSVMCAHLVLNVKQNIVRMWVRSRTSLWFSVFLRLASWFVSSSSTYFPHYFVIFHFKFVSSFNHIVTRVENYRLNDFVVVLYTFTLVL